MRGIPIRWLGTNSHAALRQTYRWPLYTSSACNVTRTVRCRWQSTSSSATKECESTTFQIPSKRIRTRKANLIAALRERNKKIAIYATAAVIAVTGLSYAAVPLYQIFCQATGYGGTTQQADEEQFKNMKPVEGGRQITVYFTADTSSSMPWKFTPEQRAVKVVPGETALAFYRAFNPTDKPVTGVSTYNVTPMRAGLYFNKIQCFCFEEQRLRPHEEIDMPVFFYVDPAFLKDPAMDNVKSITLSYTFFRTGDKEVLDIANEILKQDAGTVHGAGVMPESDATRERIKRWTEEVAAKTGVATSQSSAAPIKSTDA